ncbi:MAG: crotonase/enoyl-CoA hydratase family protein [Alphaproteobacteria bacterium]|nr:crotonase/enoyl-CoA hydratase family protein [Alphaproteobacteria bacterium]
MGTTLRTETADGVRTIVLTRPEAYNTITHELASELGQAIDEADAAKGVKVILLRSEGPAFCAGYGLDWSTEAQSEKEGRTRKWDSMADYRMMSGFVSVYQKLWYASKPTVAAVQGWCICGGTDLVLWSDLIVAAEDSVFGYPTSRLWGVPTTPMWVFRVGFENAKRYLLTGDEISAPKAKEIGLVHEIVPPERLLDEATALAKRMALVPLNQLQMIKLYCNQMAENMGVQSTRTVGIFLDGVARHTQEGDDFVTLAREVGFREAVRRRDAPFGDYGSGPRSRRKR